MTLPVYANPISLGQIQTEFGGTNPAAISEYYAGGLYTAGSVVGFPLGVQTAIPTSGVISLGKFHGATASSYTMIPTIVTKNEGDTVTFTITSIGVANTTLYWTTSGTGITTADFNDTVLTGSASLVSNTASFSRTITADNLTEGVEIATFNLRTGSISGPIVATSVVTINDTSITSSDPTYTLSRTSATVDVGGTVTISLATTNVVNGTHIPFTITGVTSADINSAPLTGLYFTAGGASQIIFTFTPTSSGKTFTLTLDGVVPTNAISVGVNLAPGSTQLELANYFWNNRTNLFRSFLSHDGTGSQSGGVPFQATIYPGDASSTGYHENSYQQYDTKVNYHFSDAASCSINVAKWTTLTWVSGRNIYWNAATPIPVTTPAADASPYVLTNTPLAHALAISQVTGDCANAPSNVYTDFHWNNWDGVNNYGVAAYSALIPGGWSIYQGPYTPVGNTGPDNTYFQYDLPSGMISLLIGSDSIDYNTSELNNLEYTGSNTITAAQTWWACSSAILAVNNTGTTVPQRMRQSVFTPAYQYFVNDTGSQDMMGGHYEDVPASNAGYGIFADGRAILIILRKTP